MSYLELPGDVVPGDVLLLDDGVVQLEVIAVEGERIVTTVLNDCFLSNRKGLNKQGGGLSLGAITEKDRELIAIAAGMNVDFIAVSFCRNAEDMNEARRVAKAHGSSAALVSSPPEKAMPTFWPTGRFWRMVAMVWIGVEDPECGWSGAHCRAFDRRPAPRRPLASGAPTR